MEPLISMNNEVNSIKYLHFVSQNKKEAVARTMKAETKSIAERYNGFDTTCQKQNNTTLEILGMIQGMKDLVPLPGNFNMIASALFDMKEGKPLFCKIQDHLMEFIHDGNFKNWQEKLGEKHPQLVFNFINSNQVVMNRLAVASKNVLSIQVAEDEKPDFALLDVEDIQDGFKHYARQLQSVKDLIVDNSHETRICELTPDDMNPVKIGFRGLSISDESNKSPPVAPSSASRKTKPTNDPVASPTKPETRPAKRVKPAGGKDFTKSGLFHYKHGVVPGNLIALLVPKHKGGGKPLCVPFTFQGNKCNHKKQVCGYQHIANWKNIKAEDQDAILKDAHTKKNFWLDEATFERHGIIIPYMYKHLLGDANGPKRT